METEKTEEGVVETIDKILSSIIDEWYENVSKYYLTKEELDNNPDTAGEAELKRFHDEGGHRIKFNKGDLDFTYGLRAFRRGDNVVIEVSVNNKVTNFDYGDFQSRLLAHYEKLSATQVPTPYELRDFTFRDIFEFDPDLERAFTVERREEKADIMRLSFRLNNRFLRRLTAHPVAGKQLIEAYCVSPFRSVYATVYRRGSR